MAFTRENLEDKIKEIYQIDKLSPLIESQITKFVRERRYKYLDIARALYYFYVEQDGDLSKAKGIGIVPYIMEESKEFFLKKEQELQRKKEEIAKQQNSQKIVIKCEKIGKSRRKQKMIDIQSIKEDN
jgi:hypothetical protein